MRPDPPPRGAELFKGVLGGVSQLLGAADAQTAHPATTSTAPAHQRRRSADAEQHRPQRPTERSDPTQHAKGRTGDCPGPHKETTTGRNVTRGGGGGLGPPRPRPPGAAACTALGSGQPCPGPQRPVGRTPPGDSPRSNRPRRAAAHVQRMERGYGRALAVSDLRGLRPGTGSAPDDETGPISD